MDKISRTVDANINRVSEGLRVLEDIFRFVLNDEIYSSKLKHLRHEVRAVVKNNEFVKFREVEKDVGKDSFTDTEKERTSVENLLVANFKRTQESFRVLEEFFKILNEEIALKFKRLRFEIYTIEHEFFSIKKKFVSLLKEARPLLYGIIDTRFSSVNHVEICKIFIKSGIEIIQLREKVLPDKECLIIAKELSQLCNESETIFIVNDRVDIAVLSNASGIHTGQDDIPIEEARELMGINKIFGVSTHNLYQVESAFIKKPDYIGFGPIYPTKSKENPDPVVGVSNLLKIKERYVGMPVVAIGGINLSNISHVLNCKPDMVCVMSGIISADDIGGAIKKYRSLINDTVRNG